MTSDIVTPAARGGERLLTAAIAVVAVTAEGDYVTIMTRRVVPYADDPSQSYTTSWFDTWRFVDGKADEHWDPGTLPTEPVAPPQAERG